MRRQHSLLALITTLLLSAGACAAPLTQMGSVSPEEVRAEQQRQLSLAAQSASANRERLDRVSSPLLRAAAPLCGSASQAGGSPARGATDFTPPVGGCRFRVVLLRDDALNAAADGDAIYVSTAMLRFASDEELSVVIAHEIAHNAMRHRDAKSRNALGGALLGAMADVAVAAMTRGRTSTNAMQAGAKAGAEAFSQDFEREADYVGLYILAWAGVSTNNAAAFWRRMAVEHPLGIVFTTTHPTTAERFVRLEQWDDEIEQKIASGVAFGPEMRDRRLSVVSRRAGTGSTGEPSGELVATVAPSAEPSAPVVDAGRTSTLARRSVPSGGNAIASPPPSSQRRSEADRRAAALAYQRGTLALGAHRWSMAKAAFAEAVRLDGSVAAHHAGLGDVLVVEEDWAGATAEYRSAVTLEPGNWDYRVALKYARAPK